MRTGDRDESALCCDMEIGLRRNILRQNRCPADGLQGMAKMVSFESHDGQIKNGDVF